MLTRLILLIALLLPAAALAADDPYLTPDGKARPVTLVYSEVLTDSGTADEWSRRISVEVGPDGIYAVRTERRGGKEILRNPGWLTEAQYAAFAAVLRQNRLLEWRESDFGMKGIGSNPCEIRVRWPGSPEWTVRFTNLQAERRRELKAVRDAFLDLVPPLDDHRRDHDPYAP